MSTNQTFQKIFSKRAQTVQSARRRKQLLYAMGALCLLLVMLYFVRQFNILMRERQASIIPPTRNEKLDTTNNKQATLTRLYEQEDKNRYRDSVASLRQNNALDYIVMDWENLYDVRKKKATKPMETKKVAPDSLAILLELLKEKKVNQLTGRPTTAKQGRGKEGKRRKRAQPAAKQTAFATNTLDPFNTVHAPGYTPVFYSRSTYGNEIPPSASTHSVIAAVVHGEHKVKAGGKVTFRLVEEARLNGTLLPKNTLLTALADFSKGRITFSNFRAKVSGAAIPLALHCYDSDMMTGIPYQGQSLVESEARKGSLTAMSNAATDLSYAIPYGTLARAGSNIARGVIRGAGRNRQLFIYLTDGYRVFLEVQPEKNNSAKP